MLTARGWAVLATGGVLLVIARGLGAAVLAVLGVAFVLLPLVAVALCLLTPLAFSQPATTEAVRIAYVGPNDPEM